MTAAENTLKRSFLFSLERLTLLTIFCTKDSRKCGFQVKHDFAALCVKGPSSRPASSPPLSIFISQRESFTVTGDDEELEQKGAIKNDFDT